jgi:hypothetical protein
MYLPRPLNRGRNINGRGKYISGLWNTESNANLQRGGLFRKPTISGSAFSLAAYILATKKSLSPLG